MSARSTSGTGITPSDGPADRVRRRGGLVVLLVVLALGAFTLLGAQVAVSVTGQGEPALVPLVVTATAGTVVVALALALGQLELQRATVPGPDGRRAGTVSMRVWSTVTGVLAVAQAVAALLGGVPAWLVLLFLAAVVGLMATSRVIGRRSLHAARAREGSCASDGGGSGDPVWTPADIRRRVLIVVAVLVGTAILATVLLAAFDDGFAGSWALILQLALTAAAITGLAMAARMQWAAASITRDLVAADRKAVGRRSVGKGDPLDPEREWRAARLAAVMRVSQPFIISSFLLLLAAQAMSAVSTGAEGPALVLIVLGSAFVLVIIPFAVVEQRRRSRYARATTELARARGPRAARVDE